MPSVAHGTKVVAQLTVVAVDHLSCLTASQLDENLPKERTTLLKAIHNIFPNERTTSSSKSFSQSCRDRSHDSLRFAFHKNIFVMIDL